VLRGWLVAAFLCGMALVCSCGYSTSAGVLPTHLKTVAIPAFENTTTEYALQQEITDAVIKEFVSNNSLKVVDERSASAVIRGRIVEYRNSVFGISAVDRAEEYRITIGVAVTFKDLVKNREIWNDEHLVKSANYYVNPVPGDSARTEVDGRKRAIEMIADEILSRSVQSW
jgi:hypothetical protein